MTGPAHGWAAGMLAGLSPRQRELVAKRLAATTAAQEAGSTPGLLLPATSAQERIWRASQARSREAFVLRNSLRLAGPVAPARIAAALGSLQARHPALRQRFQATGDGLRVSLRPSGESALPVLELACIPAGQRRAARERAVRELMRDGIDPGSGILLGGLLVHEPSSAWRLEVCIHHLAADGWSLRVLAADLAALLTGAQSADPGEPVPWRQQELLDYETARLTGPAGDRLRRYWAGQLAGATLTHLSAPDPRPTGGGRVATVRAEIPRSGLLPWRQRGVGADFATLTAAVAVTVAAAVGDPQVTLLTLVSDRPPGFGEHCGVFLNTVPLRVGTQTADFTGLQAQVQAMIGAAIEHAALPYEDITAAAGLGPASPLSNVLCVLHEARARGGLTGLQVIAPGSAEGDLPLDVAFEFRPSRAGIELSLSFRRDVLSLPAARVLAARVAALLDASGPQRSPADLLAATASAALAGPPGQANQGAGGSAPSGDLAAELLASAPSAGRHCLGGGRIAGQLPDAVPACRAAG